jgi:uncharacterized protein (TIGR02118 family)
MPTTITVMYENTADATFKLDYYLKKHMPLVSEKFTPHGLKSWRVVKAAAGPTGDKPPYSIIATLEFDNTDQFKAAIAAEGGPVFGDVPNFSNKSPVVVIGDVVGSG